MRSLRQKLADLPSLGPGHRREPVRSTAGAPRDAEAPPSGAGSADDEELVTIEREVVLEESVTIERQVVLEEIAPGDDEDEASRVRRRALQGPTSGSPGPDVGLSGGRRRALQGPTSGSREEASAELGRSIAKLAKIRSQDEKPRENKPSLDELRSRIAALVGHREPPKPRADPSAGELPFFVERTASGPRYVRRVRAAPAARVGRAPLVAARDADPVTLGLLALDPAIAGCDPKRALYLDTETTGLAGGTGTVAFLVGLAFFDEDHGTFLVEQMLLRRLGEEAPILELVEKRLAAASMVVTYNGKAFDMPLLRTRFVMNRMKRPAELPHLDLLHVARRVHKHRLSSCTLAMIEHEVLGRGRVGDVSGMDIVEAYMHFLRTGDEALLSGVVTHNEHDVLAMVALLGLYGEPFGVVSPDPRDERGATEGAVAIDARGAIGSLGGEGAEGFERSGSVHIHADARRTEKARGAPYEEGAPTEHTDGMGESIDVDFETGVRLKGDAPCGLGAGLSAIDLAGVARTLQRAGAIERAQALAGEAMRAGGGTLARRVSADIHRARGDTEAALREYEALLVEEPDPEVRLLLAKMYEHRVRAYDRALAILADGTTESDEATTLRRARLERKLLAASERASAQTRLRRKVRKSG